MDPNNSTILQVTPELIELLSKEILTKVKAMIPPCSFQVKAPVGTIVIWKGSIADIPSGWHLCDGTDDTPDLRDKFIAGAGGEYDVGATGGAKTVTLTTAQMPEHDHNKSVVDVSYGQNMEINTSNARSDSTRVRLPEVVKGSNIGGAVFTQKIGSGAAHENRPPYYALAYIMKVEEDPEGEYSLEEVRIGTWIDNKPLYRRVYKIKTPDEVDVNRTIATVDGAETITNFWGWYSKEDGATPPLNAINGDERTTTVYMGNQVIQSVSRYDSLNRDGYLVVEYTKTTD